MHPQEKGAHSHILNKSLAVTFTNYAHNLQLTHFSPVSHFYTSPPPPPPQKKKKNVRKLLVFRRFQGVCKCDAGLKWVNLSICVQNADR